MPPPSTFAARRRESGPIPVTLVTGFLGSGKTTLINHILRNRGGVRAAVLVNELGEIGIDNELIVGAEGGMIELSNGCVCCSTNSDLVDAIARVLARPQPVDHLLVETTGIADPLPVALTFQRPEFRGALRLEAIVAVAEAEQFSLEHFDGVAARSQLRHADAILVNKCDRAEAPQLAAIEAALRRLNPHARLLRTTYCDVALPLILDVDLFQPGRADAPDHGHLDSDGYVSFCFESEQPLSARRFQAFLEGRPRELVRGKGFLWLAETGKRYEFHLIGDRFTLEEDAVDRPNRNRLVLIGRDLDREALQRALALCLHAAKPEV
ncbi:MAG: GTP-binding protein [Alphaproteobacteria bacterium]|nr:GTP-binding protein [Alphaproteobacteria bacterium]